MQKPATPVSHKERCCAATHVKMLVIVLPHHAIQQNVYHSFAPYMV